MFEKEAEEWVVDSVCKDCSRYEKCKSKEHCTCKECTKEKWQKGAEFGYNKAKEEMQEQGLALQSDMDKTIEQNIALKKQIEKMKSCSNCIHYSSTFGLCHYSMGDEDYDCRGRKWEIKEND